MKKMNQNELEAIIAAQLDVCFQDGDLVKDCLDSMFKRIKESMHDGDVVRLRGFGVFRAVTRERRCVNPRTQEPMGLQIERIVVFTPNKSMVNIHG